MPANLSLHYGCPSILDRLMEETGENSLPMPQGTGATHFPPVQMVEDELALHVRIIIPGVPADEIQLTLDAGVLSVQGRIALLPGRHTRRDLPVGPFRRDIRLPAPVSADGVQAVVTHGILSVTLAKMPNSYRRSIPVRGEGE